jgi:hypothetical protein
MPLFQRLLISTLLLFAMAISVQSQIVINELDPSGPGLDDVEFVELFGSPGEDLSGFIVVIYNGSNAQSNNTFDLNGYVLDENGFFLIGGPNLIGADFTVDQTNWLQVGQEAVAIYDASSADFPNGTAVTDEDLLDAAVYGNNQPPASALIEVLTPNANQLNESAQGLADYQSLARLPNGGVPFATSEYILQAPTPGYSNVLECDGGQIELQLAANENICTDASELVLVQFIHNNDVPEADFTLVVVNQETALILASFDGVAANMAGLGDVVLEVVGISHAAPLDAASIAPGQPLSGITGTGCFSMTINSISIQGETCSPPACDGGAVTDAAGTPTVLGCNGLENSIITFGYTSEAIEAEYIFVITDAAQIIQDTTAFPQYDFSLLGEGAYQVWGSSALGGFNEATLTPGEPLSGVLGVECDSLSTSYLSVDILDCESASFCEEIFISEYVEGNSNNKAIELYNPSPVDIDLTGYHMETWNNGATAPTNTQELSGTIEANGVFVLVNALAAPELYQAADVVSQITWYNGNDVIALYHDGEIIDQMGVFGEDPGDPWSVDGGAGEMAEFTLVRKANVSQGSIDWAVGQFQWDAYPQDNFDFIGYHNATCTGSPDMELGFTNSDLYVYEGGGVEVTMQVAYPLQNVTVSIDVVGGTASEGDDYPAVFPLPEFNFPIGLLNDQSFTFAAIDEEEPEGEETVVLAMQITSGDAVLIIDTLTVHIQPSDLTYPVYDIETVRSVGVVSGEADSLGVSCELRGIVHGWNDYPSGLQFTLIDSTHGINVFGPLSDFGYEQVVPGDSVRIRGTVGQFAGLTQIIADTLIYEGSGFITEQPILVQALDESRESHVVTLKCVELVNPDQWTNSAPSFEVDVTTGASVYTMRVDANTDLFLSEAPVGVFGLSGIVDQRDFEAPYFDGYRISPRYLSDISEPVNAEFAVTSPWNLLDGPIELENNSTGASGYYWTFGNGDNSDESVPEYSYDESGIYSIVLTTFSIDGNCSDQSSLEIDVLLVSVDELGWSGRVYPNPTHGRVFFESSETIESIQVLNLAGAVVRNESPNSTRWFTDTSDLVEGMYVVLIQTPTGTKSLKLVREN